VAEKRERVWHQNRRADALRRPRRDQDRRGRGKGTRQRSGRENREAGHEDSFGAQAIAQSAGGEDQRGEGDRVGADDPLQLR